MISYMYVCSQYSFFSSDDLFSSFLVECINKYDYEDEEKVSRSEFALDTSAESKFSSDMSDGFNPVAESKLSSSDFKAQSKYDFEDNFGESMYKMFGDTDDGSAEEKYDVDSKKEDEVDYKAWNQSVVEKNR
jgi:hypothetical protein